MSIKILPARLANQIAAGEVVERPASVLKELLENSIDAGATAIEVEIEKGGHKKIKLTDNGAGIRKEQLTLALSRHATSKIHDLDDLEHIVTLGFRGEALASISSVSRLTLTSKTADQNEAWQACCEGRDMEVSVQPAAHPKGTSVEALDLFFNTPARRKFLRTEKTEFNHIEALFRRFALSQFGVSLKLKHNGKLIKSLPAIKEPENYIKRIRQICGPVATEGLVALNSEYQQFRLWGWISAPGQHQAMNDHQFVFVNNRMMKDKLIFHAIRQAYEGVLPEDKFPYFVLYLEIPSDEVDVNVHPAKHEVRFHQSRLIHDFIFSAINDALGESFAVTGSNTATVTETVCRDEVSHQYQAVSRADVSQPTPSAPSTDRREYIAPLQSIDGHSEANSAAAPRQPYQSSEAEFKAAAANYQALVTSPMADVAAVQHISVPGIGLLIKEAKEVWLIPSNWLIQRELASRLQVEQAIMQPLLLPVSVNCKQSQVSEVFLQSCKKLGLDMQQRSGKLMLKAVPVGARQQCWQDILVALCDTEIGADQSHIIAVLSQHWRLDEQQSLMSLWQKFQAQDNTVKLKDIARKLPLVDWLESMA